MPKYKKCPRCELNYILETEDYCPVCKDEIKGIVTEDADLDDEFTKLCPRCGINYITDDQEYCESCRADIEEINAIHDAEDAPWQEGDSKGEDSISLDDLADAETEEELDDQALVLDDDMLAELESEDEADAELDAEEEVEPEADDFDDFELGDEDDYEEDEEDIDADDDAF